MENKCKCGHEEKVHVLGVCAVLGCPCVRRDLQKTINEDGTIALPVFLDNGLIRTR